MLGKTNATKSGFKIQPVTNLTLSDEGVLSWNSPDISEIENKGYTATFIYDIYINDEYKFNTNSTSVALGNYLVVGENNIKVIAKGDIKYFESDDTEIVGTWAGVVEVTVTTLGATLPTVLAQTSAVAINYKAYIFGGFNGSTSNTILEFDPNENIVTTLSATLPKAMYFASAVAINNKAYIFGGDSSSYLNTILEFDPNTNTVTTLSAILPTALRQTSAVAINNKAYVFGGFNDSVGYLDTIVRIDNLG